MKKELTTQELIKLSKEIFRVYYKGDDDLFVVILPICALGNDGVVFRK